MKNVLKVHNLSKSFKKNFLSKPQFALDHLNFSIPKGSITGFLGANGSGKTTTFKCLFSFIKPDEGDIEFFENKSLSEKNKERIGFLPEHPQFYQDLSAEELLLFYGRLSKPSLPRVSLKERVNELLKDLNLSFFKNYKIKTFSKGMMQRLGIAQAYLSYPEFVILDEPFSGLDPEGRFYVASLIEKMHQEGGTAFLSSHIFQDIERLCDRLIMLRNGKNIFEGTFASFTGQSQENRRISFLKNNKKEQCFVSSLSECQKKIQSLIQNDSVILSVQAESSSLESAYKELLKNPKGSSV